MERGEIVNSNCLKAVMLFFCFMLSFSIISASFSLGNPSSNITDKYVSLQNIKGWINLSFTNENYNSLFKLNEDTITLKSLLEKNPDADYECSSSECGMTYGSLSAGAASQAINLNAGESKIIGMNIIENSAISSIGELFMTISSNAAESCSSPLSIDLFDDGIVDWIADKQTSSFCSADFGCYSASASSAADIIINPSKIYCQQVKITPAPAFRVGAYLTNSGSGESEFKFSVSELDGISCINKTSASGEISCLINRTLTESMNITVCMSKLSGNNYKINVEDSAPVCGLIGESAWDMAIFAKPMKFGAVGSVVLNSSELEADIYSYIMNNYESCLAGCYIPVKLISGASQQINLAGASVSYQARDVDKSSQLIYLLDSVPAVINSGVIQLNLDSSGLKVPIAPGKSNITIFLSNTPVLTKSIEVLNVPLIDVVTPLQVPVAIETKFYVYALGSNTNSYKWDFGDNTTITTNVPTATHKYSEIKSYTLEVTASNANGENTKQFTVNVISPKDYINKTLSENKAKIASLKLQTLNFSASAKSHIEKKLNLQSLETKIQELYQKFNSAAGDDSEYITIAGLIPVFNLPDSVFISEKSSGKLFIDKSLINLNAVNSITKETTPTNEETKSAIVDWALSNIDASFDIKSYSAMYGGIKSDIVSNVVLKLSSPTGVNNAYLIINKPSSDVEVLGGAALSSSGDYSGLSTGMGSLEFFITGNIEIKSIPFYISPKLSELAPSLIEEICNYNRLCEAERGENPENCKNDCISLKKRYITLGVIFILFLVIYIAIQEFYRRYYEKTLFKDHNELFNLINFMDNAENQGMKRKDISEKLKEAGWPSKKVEYAYKKFKGERMGIFEIPLFKFFEKQQVKKGLEEYKKKNTQKK